MVVGEEERETVGAQTLGAEVEDGLVPPADDVPEELEAVMV